MTITFYKSVSEINEFPKRLTGAYSIEGTLRNQCSITDPVIDFEGFQQYVDYNYAYIADFKRYYFIASAESITNTIIEFSFHVDVLQSFSEQILSHDAFINRCGNIRNKWIVDDLVPLYPPKYDNVIQLKADPAQASTVFTRTSRLDDVPVIFATVGIKAQNRG